MYQIGGLWFFIREIIINIIIIIIIIIIIHKIAFLFVCVCSHVALSLAQNPLSHKSSVLQNLPLSEGSRATDLLKAAIELNAIIKRIYRYKQLFSMCHHNGREIAGLLRAARGFLESKYSP